MRQKLGDLSKKCELLELDKKAQVETILAFRSAAESGSGMVETLNKKLAEEHKVNAQLVFFNRSLKTQVCELEDAKDELTRQLEKAVKDLDRLKAKYPHEFMEEEKEKKGGDKKAAGGAAAAGSGGNGASGKEGGGLVKPGGAKV
ncbi:hypothetical protein BCR44DRAFT_1431164 [Catenaria anguillulae PL171]|uniref:Uncharacterized protein n=1 Tax=Catenaria anguillulae PL171 TaxID=765915 RepID=A0A1Y2HQR2_9FUNG|nr:hypothetical protein BCR44DRAFT_1431164 [Catenaria anguillulae PL171]